MSLGENIYKFRTGKHLSQEDFAAAMEVSRQSVSKWENDMAVPELEKLVKMAKLFEVSLDELVGNTPSQSKQETSSAPAPAAKSAFDFDAKTAVSMGLLIAALFIPAFYFIMHFMHPHVWTHMEETLKDLPLFATAISALLVPNSKLLYHTYQIFLIILSLLLLSLLSEGIWFILLDWLCFAIWSYRRK